MAYEDKESSDLNGNDLIKMFVQTQETLFWGNLMLCCDKESKTAAIEGDLDPRRRFVSFKWEFKQCWPTIQCKLSICCRLGEMHKHLNDHEKFFNL